MSRIEFLGLRFDPWSLADATRWLAERDAGSDYAYLVTPNVDHVVRFAGLPEAERAAYATADVTLCDSRVLARLARWAGVTLPVAPGSDLAAALFGQVLGRGDRVCLIGGRPDDATVLEARYSGIAVIQHQPPMGLRGDSVARAAAIDAAMATDARAILFAVGSPQQEMLAHEMSMRAGARGTGLCIGAAIDFLSGAQTRAPLPFRRLGIEWAWRLLSDPRRLARRYLVDGPAIFPLVWRWRCARRR